MNRSMKANRKHNIYHRREVTEGKMKHHVQKRKKSSEVNCSNETEWEKKGTSLWEKGERKGTAIRAATYLWVSTSSTTPIRNTDSDEGSTTHCVQTLRDLTHRPRRLERVNHARLPIHHPSPCDSPPSLWLIHFPVTHPPPCDSSTSLSSSIFL